MSKLILLLVTLSCAVAKGISPWTLALRYMDCDLRRFLNREGTFFTLLSANLKKMIEDYAFYSAQLELVEEYGALIHDLSGLLRNSSLPYELKYGLIVRFIAHRKNADFDFLNRLLSCAGPSDGNPLISQCILEGNYAGVTILIDLGADVNMLSITGQTPLFVAARIGETEIVKLLLANPRTDTAIACNGITPLMIACMSGHLDTARLFPDFPGEPL